METATERTIEQLVESTWFRDIGGTSKSDDWIRVSDWNEAIAACEAREASGVALQAANDLREGILRASKDQFRLWNKKVISIRPKVIRLVKKKAVVQLAGLELAQEVIDHINWDMLHWFMELEYADIVAPGFYGKLGSIYLLGHFPCGWEDGCEAGKPIVY